MQTVVFQLGKTPARSAFNTNIYKASRTRPSSEPSRLGTPPYLRTENIQALRHLWGQKSWRWRWRWDWLGTLVAVVMMEVMITVFHSLDALFGFLFSFVRANGTNWHSLLTLPWGSLFARQRSPFTFSIFFPFVLESLKNMNGLLLCTNTTRCFCSLIGDIFYNICIARQVWLKLWILIEPLLVLVIMICWSQTFGDASNLAPRRLFVFCQWSENARAK